MLARSAMAVVFVPAEKIRSGILNRMTADTNPKGLCPWRRSLRCHSDGVCVETRRVERDKPLKRETQIW